METFFKAFALAGMYIGFLAVIETLRRKNKISAEITRRLAHIFSGLCTVINFWLLPSEYFIALVLISLIGATISQRFGILTAIHGVSRRTYGEIFLPLGVLASYAVSAGKSDLFIPSILVMTFADSLAGLVSTYYKEPRKMLRGSLVFFLVSLSILIGTGSGLGQGLLVATLLTLIERYSPIGSDNLTVPAAASALLLFL